MQAILFDGRSAAAQRVTLRFEADALAIEGAGALRRWALRRSSAMPQPDGSVVIADRDTPARLLVNDAQALQALRAGYGRRWPRSGLRWGTAMASCVAAGLVAVALIALAPDIAAPLVPQSWEAAVGDRALDALAGAARHCTGAVGQAALDRLVTRLAAADGVTAPVRLVVLDRDTANAFTIPGARIAVMRGLIAEAGDGDELAGVIAHEMGHVAHRDPTRQTIRSFGLGALGAVLGWGSIDAARAGGVLLSLSYGRAAETAADAAAVRALHDSGLRADGLARFLARVERMQPGAIAFLSDHPATADRVARVAQPPTGAPALDVAEWAAVRDMCRPDRQAVGAPS